MKALLVCTSPAWLSSARMPGELARAGFDVRLLAGPGTLAGHSRFLSGVYTYPKGIDWSQMALALAQVVATWKPDVLVPGEDPVVHLLHGIHQEGRKRWSAALLDLIERSVGDPERYDVLDRKSRLPEACEAAGVALPPQVLASSAADVAALADRVGWPIVLKPDFGAASQGVRVCASIEEAEAHLREERPNLDVWGRPVAYSAQKFVPGPLASVPFVAHRGRVLGAYAFEKLHLFPEVLGTTSVARLLDRPDLVEATERLVAHYGFTGFGGVAFIVEEGTGRPHVIEVNPRAVALTPSCRAFGFDFAAMLGAALRGEPVPSPGPPIAREVAIFPSEWTRDPRSPYLLSAYHDVPWDDPALLHAMTRMGLASIDPNTAKSGAPAFVR